MQSPDLLDIVPEHVADPVRRAPWRVRLLRGSSDGLLSLVLNGAVVAGLVAAGWPLRPMPEPQTVSVDLVDHMPGSKGTGPDGGTAGGTSPAKPDTAVAEAQQDKARDAAAPDVAAPQVLAPQPPAPQVPAPQAPVPQAPTPQAPTPQPLEPKPQSEAAPQPEVPPELPVTPPVPAATEVPPSAPEGSPAEAVQAQPAAPPPPEHPDNIAAPQLVEAPSAPPPAATQDQTAAEAATTASAEAPDAPPAAPPAQHPVLAAPEDADTVPLPAPPPEAPKPLSAEQQRQADTTAKLAAILPFGTNIRSDPFQAATAARGEGASTAYRGQVYANFNKQGDVIAAAKARHLKGQAVVAFTLDDAGGLARLAIAVSSGDPEVDRAALELIRRGAPYPPPPPGAQRSFSPAIGLGLDE